MEQLRSTTGQGTDFSGVLEGVGRSFPGCSDSGGWLPPSSDCSPRASPPPPGVGEEESWGVFRAFCGDVLFDSSVFSCMSLFPGLAAAFFPQPVVGIFVGFFGLVVVHLFAFLVFETAGFLVKNAGEGHKTSAGSTPLRYLDQVIFGQRFFSGVMTAVTTLCVTLAVLNSSSTPLLVALGIVVLAGFVFFGLRATVFFSAPRQSCGASPRCPCSKTGGLRRAVIFFDTVLFNSRFVTSVVSPSLSLLRNVVRHGSTFFPVYGFLSYFLALVACRSARFMLSSDCSIRSARASGMKYELLEPDPCADWLRA